jgi:hypothetical protein
MLHTTRRRATTALAALIAGGLAAAPAMAAPFLVTSAADNGPGTLRAALEAASNSGEAATIVVATAADIELASFLNYWGTEPVEIIGSGQTISTREDVTLLTISQGADVTIMNLTFEGPGGWDIENRSDVGRCGWQGHLRRSPRRPDGHRRDRPRERHRHRHGGPRHPRLRLHPGR